MRLRFVTVSVVLLWGWTQLVLAAQSEITITVTDEKANLRAGPGTDYDLVGALPNGGTARATGRSARNDWIQIEYPGPGQRAWLYAPLVSVQGGTIESLPVIDTPPTPTLPPTPTGDSVLNLTTPAPTRLPTFTPPPAVSPITYEAPVLEGGRFPIALVIIGLFLFGLFAGVMAVVRRNA